ncbi:butyryl-CoA dehydrogenase [Pseudonocardia sp. N23]|nr:butyryl-CoA dehydrogenase [Pseudonocardia sp. N23]
MTVTWELDDEHREFRDVCRGFVDKVVRPHVDAAEAAGAFPADLWKPLGDAGMLGLVTPPEFGGSDGDALAVAVPRCCRCHRDGRSRPGSRGLPPPARWTPTATGNGLRADSAGRGTGTPSAPAGSPTPAGSTAACSTSPTTVSTAGPSTPRPPAGPRSCGRGSRATPGP